MTQARWYVHPLALSPGRGALVALWMAGFTALVGWSFASAWWAAFALVVMAASTAGFWFPTRYEVDADGVGWRRLGGGRRRCWEDLRRFEEWPGGVLLSPFARPTVLDRVRGLELRFSGTGEREMVMSAVRTRIGGDEGRR